MSVADQGSPAPSLRRLPFTIRLSPQLVNQLSAQRDRRLQPGEVSGLLFGLVEGGLVIAQAYRTFDEGVGVSGAAERSSQDQMFERQLTASQKAPETASLNLIGWYAIREGGGLSASDLTYHDWYFPRPNDIALILKPEGSSNISLEIYCRTVNGLLSEEGHRLGLVRLSTAPLESPVEVVPRPKIQDDFFMRAYEIGDTPQEKARGWKGTLAVRYRKAFSFLHSSEGEHTPLMPSPPLEEKQPAQTSPPKHAQPALGSLTQPIAIAAPVAAKSSLVENIPAPSPAAPPPSQALSVTESVFVPAQANPVQATMVGRAFSEPPRPKPLWPSVVAVFVLTSALTFGAVYFLQISDILPRLLRTFSSEPALGLKVEAQGDRLLVTWNRQHPLVGHARNGFLMIEDGETRRQLMLDASHVANGSILYHPNSDDVTFRLEVHGADGQQASESMRVLDASKPASAKPALELYPLIPPRSASGAGQAQSFIPRPNVAAQQETAPAATNAGFARSEPIAAANADSAKAGNDLRANANKSASGTEEEVQAVPEDHPAAPGESSKLAATTGAPTAGPVAQGLQPSSLPGESAQEPATQTSKSPLAQGSIPPVPSSYQPPRPTRQVIPNVSGVAPTILAQTGRVELLVMVDERGRVTDVKTADNGKRVNQALLGTAMTAARQWIFEPATLHGKAIASQHSIVFQFAPRAQ